MKVKRASQVTLILVTAIVILLTAIYFYPSSENNEPASHGWRMIYGNPQGNCLSDYGTSHLTGKIVRSITLGDTVRWLLVSGNGMIYLLSKGKIISLDAEGNALWESPMDFSLITPAIDEYGNVYAATADGRIVSLNEKGEVRWTFRFREAGESASAPLIVQHKQLYALTTAGNFYILNYEGNLLARVHLSGTTSVPPVISPSGEVYVGTNNSVYVLTSSGSVVRKTNLKGGIIRMALYGKELYITTLDIKFSPYPVVKNLTPYLFALSDDGKVSWEINLNELGAEWGIPESLAVSEDAVYVGIKPSALPSGEAENKTQNHSFIMKFDKRGNLIWKRGFYEVINGLALNRDGVLYATFSRYSVMSDRYCKLRALTQDGEMLWFVNLRSYVNAPIIGPAAVYLYGGTHVYAVG